MNPIIKRCGSVLLAIGAALVVGTAPVPSPGDTFTHTVTAGESVSLICIDYYGHYSEALGKAVLASNPSIKNIDVIYAGQVLTLRKPVETAGTTVSKTPATPKTPPVTPAPTGAEDAVFVKKLNITQGVVTCVEGSAQFSRGAPGKLQPLKINTIVSPGCIIETGADGRVEIIINRESVIRLREKTRTVLEAFRNSGNAAEKTRVGCSLGAVWTKVKKFKDRIGRFELELPTAIAGVHGTVYESVVAPDSSAEVRVFNGEVAVSCAAVHTPGPPVEAGAPSEVPGPHEVAPPQEVTMEHWTQILREMQSIRIDNRGTPSAPESFVKNSGDSWERWNEERDRRIAALFGERAR